MVDGDTTPLPEMTVEQLQDRLKILQKRGKELEIMKAMTFQDIDDYLSHISAINSTLRELQRRMHIKNNKEILTG